MIELSVSLASNGVVKVPGYEQMVRFGYTKNRGVYRLAVTATGEWEGLTIRAFWHVPNGKDPTSSMVVDGLVGVPASVTAQPGSGCITFEGSDGTKTVTSADLRYRVAANSGTEDGTEPEPGTPAWQELVDAVHTDATAAEQAKTDAQTAAQQAGAAAQKAASSEKAAGDAQKKAADSLQELKDGIASGDFKGEPGTSPTVTVQDITGGHRIVITDATGTSSVDVLNGKQGDPGKPGDTGATPELTIGTVEEGDAPSATITGTAKNPVLNLTLKSGAPGKDGLDTPQIDDAVVSAENPWSSRKIIETLCPPLEESGNPVMCYPVSGYPLGCKVSWEPTQEGSGDPSPDNIRPISGRDSMKVERCGKNLWSLGDIGFKQYKEISVNYPAGDYKFSCEVETESTNSTVQVGRFFDGEWVYSQEQQDKRIKILIRASVGIFAFRFYAGSSSADHSNATFKNIQLELERGATAYVPYTGQKTTITLPRTIYGGEVDAVTGEGQETWETVTLDGTENWTQNTSVPNPYFIATILHLGAFTLGSLMGICTAFPLVDINASTNNNGFNGWNTALYIRWASLSTVDTLKSYLATQYAAGTPVQVCYKPKTPTSFTATGAQPIPALPGVNTVLTDADSATVTGRADPIKRITDLEDAVASMTNT